MKSIISKNIRFILITGLVIFFILLMVSPVSATPNIQTTKTTVVRGTDTSDNRYKITTESTNIFDIIIFGDPNTGYFVFINDNTELGGITPPTLPIIPVGQENNFSIWNRGTFRVTTDRYGFSTQTFVVPHDTTPGIYTFKFLDNNVKFPVSRVTVEVLAVAPTPTPTPSIGSVVVTSSPAGATIFLDNAIKGITPLTLDSVPNGNHVVLLKFDGYRDSSKSVNVLADTQTVNLVLELKSNLTTATTSTPKPTAKVNYSATIAAMQSQIAEQGTKITEQGNILDSIVNFLRNVFGWK